MNETLVGCAALTGMAFVPVAYVVWTLRRKAKRSASVEIVVDCDANGVLKARVVDGRQP